MNLFENTLQSRTLIIGLVIFKYKKQYYKIFPCSALGQKHNTNLIQIIKKIQNLTIHIKI